MTVGRLVINKQYQLPLYLQLKEQLKTAINLGNLAPGARLPGIRQLAETLGVNQNTVFRALKELEQEGYIRMEQGRGAFVNERTQGPAIANREDFDRLVAGFILRTQALGIPLEDVVSAVISAGLQGSSNADVALHGVFVEANRITADRDAAELTRKLGVPFTPVLLQDLQLNFAAWRDVMEQADLVVTPVVHRPEVEALLYEHLPGRVSLYTVNMEQMTEVALQLSTVAPDSKVGVVCMSQEDARVMQRAITKALPQSHLHFLKASVEEPAEVEKVLNHADVLVLSSAVQGVLAGRVPARTRVISYRNNLDEAGLQMLRQVVVNLRSRKLRDRGEVP